MQIKRWTQRPSYAELDQPNPLRWQIYFEESDLVFAPQTGKIKCRDFFNDIVAARKGQPFYIYGLNGGDIKTNDDGVWISLTGVKESLSENLKIWLQSYLEQVSGQELRVIRYSPKRIFIKIPSFFWEKTYYISLATLLIRLSNYGKVFSDINECISSIAEFEGHVYTTTTSNKLLKYKFELPAQFADVWWWSSLTYNSGKTDIPHYQKTSCIHNSGINAYLNYAE